MRRLYNHVPNALTSLNLLFGSLSIIYAVQGELQQASYLLLLAFYFDIFDGLLARLLKVQSDIGKELDSLADVISFGLGPAAILFAMLMPALGIETIHLGSLGIKDCIVFIPFIIPIFAALRLARFNLSTGKTRNFIGMPTPANALMVLSIPLIANNHPGSFLVIWFNSPTVILVYSVVASFLMVSPLRFYSLKLKGFSWPVNKYTYFFLICVVVILVSFGYTGIFLVVAFYMVYAFILARILKNRTS